MIVTFDTAQRLKEAGFPQPEPGDGQVWYDRYENLGVLSLLHGAPGARPEISVLLFGDSDTFSLFDMDGFVFAPMATDIMHHLPGHAMTIEGELWVIFDIETGDYISDWHENPAEAAAQAWLHKNTPLR